MDTYSRPAEFGWRAFARYDVVNDAHDLYVAYRGTDRRAFAVQPLSFAPGPAPGEGVAIAEPTLKGSLGWSPEEVGGDARGFLQVMMDVAWDLGLRPKRLAEHESELKAVRYHLEDMRALAKVPAR